MKFVKENLLWIFCAGLGLLNFILLTIPYVTYVYDLNWLGISSKNGLSGYSAMSFWRLGFGGVMSSIFQIFALLCGMALLAVGVVGILKQLNIVKIPDKLGNFSFDMIGKLLMYIFAGLNILIFIFLIIMCSSNSERIETIFYGYRLSAGIFITLVFSIGAIVSYIILNKKFNTAQ